MKEVTLRTTMNRVLLATLGIIGVVAVAILFAYAQIKQSVAIHSLVLTLERDTPAQIEALIPSFLVPEQSSGAMVLLERFRSAGGYDEIKILQLGERLAGDFSTCVFRNEPQTCVEEGGRRIAYIAPIREGSQLFGYLVKVKQISNPFHHDMILHIIEAILIVLILVFLSLFVVISRITAREIPDELSNLANWIATVLEERATAKVPKLRFKELNTLGEQIAQLLERHEKARDQAVVGQLTSGIMHDLKTPIHPIMIAHGLVAEKEVGTPKRLQFLENLFRVCLTNLPIINNLIEATLDGSREIHIEPRQVDLRETLTQALALHSHAVKNRNLQMDITMGDVPVLLLHDPVQMSRVFANILKNSIEAIDEARARNKVHSGDVRITLERTIDGGVKVLMEDSGLGLPTDTEKIFRVFRSSKPRGSGLGLMISRKIVEAHGGQMSASRSERLSGARFDVLIPGSQK